MTGVRRAGQDQRAGTGVDRGSASDLVRDRVRAMTMNW
jgi:hypothetical protein